MMEREKAQELMRSLAKEYANSDTKHVTLLCFCPDEKFCHRRLVKEMILSIYQSYISSRKMTTIDQLQVTTLVLIYEWLLPILFSLVFGKSRWLISFSSG